MAGIYVHVPFCRSKCFYCGFYSVASSRLKKAYIAALEREIRLRKDYLGASEVKTLYLGGGTPSWLSLDELTAIVATLEMNFALDRVTERTIEANPEDITPEKLSGWRALGFNRLSIGVQSFNDEMLKRINRTHSAQDALRSVKLAADWGFENTGIDLILGLPGYTRQYLQRDLEIVSHLPVSHLSVYLLSIDSNTVFEKLLQKGQFQPLADDEAADQYLWVSDYLKSIGYEHYEISNFAKNSKYSIHNTSYWQQRKYVGFGPAAHSFDLDSRQWNVSHLKSYIDGLNKDSLNFEKEILTDKDKFNEYIMTNLRTMWGIQEEEMLRQFPAFSETVRLKLAPYLETGSAVCQNGRIRLTEKGWLVSDEVFSDLFVV